MIYSYKCDCGKTRDVTHLIDEKPEILCECGKRMYKEFCTNFICKGPGFPSTQMREKRQREKRSEELKIKQRKSGLSVKDKVGR